MEINKRVEKAFSLLKVDMEEEFNPVPSTYLLQHTLRSLCIQESSLWDYAIFWRILPRCYPPPNLDVQGGPYDRSRGIKKCWMLAWEDGFCNFLASKTEINSQAGSSAAQNCSCQHFNGLQPELFFKMSYEIFNYGEGLIGKVAADNKHKWVYNGDSDQETISSAWQNSGDLHPRTWMAQFQSGIKTIALIAVKEGVLQLGAVKRVTEDISYISELQKKFSYLHSIPGFLLPHPSSSLSFMTDGAYNFSAPHTYNSYPVQTPLTMNFSNHYNQPLVITPSISSLEVLLSKFPPAVPATSPTLFHLHDSPPGSSSPQNPPEENGMETVEKEHV